MTRPAILTRLAPGLLRLVAAGCLLAVLAGAARAQSVSGTDIITGQVTDREGEPVEGANIEAMSLETQITRRTRTDARGRFTILFPDGGGQYRMTVRAVGMAPRIEVVQRHADEDRIIWNVRVNPGTITLATINVNAGPQMVRVPEGPTPGSAERAFGIDQTSRLPTDASDLALLAALVPGVLSIAGTDSSATSFSVAGLGPEANAMTLDGLLFGNSSIPQEGLRQTRVVTSTYDVSRGQFSGGLIASTTRSGSNVVQGSSQYQLRDDDLSVTSEDSPYAQGYTQNVISGGLGGPLVRDRLFIYGSAQARMRSDPQQTLLSGGTPDLTRLGVSPDSVQRFLGIVSGLGVPYNSVPGSATRSNNNLSALARLDYVLSDAHTLTLRGDWRGTSQDPTRLGSLALPQTGGLLESGGGGVMGTITSRFGATVLNEFRGYLQWSSRDGNPFSLLPSGRVQVTSDLPDSTRSVATLVFGGNTGLPNSNRTSSIEISNEASWLPGSGAHRVKIGGFALSENTRDVLGSNQLGTFTYNSLAALENGLPASFRRSINVVERDSRNYRWGLFAGDVWMVSRPLQLTYGLRLEGSAFGNPPAYNPAVDSAFGRRTDRLPSEWQLSPRVGFTLSLGGVQIPNAGGGPGRGFGGGGGFAGRTAPTLVIRGGIGEFRSQPPTSLVAQARGATGFAASSGEIVCTGAGVPLPAWDQYWLDPANIPTQCAGGGPSSIQSARSVTVLADGFEAPRAWRGSLGLEKRLTQIMRFTVDGSFSRGVAQAGSRDLNLNAIQRFSLASEGGRPVYVTPADITPATGTARFTASRVDSAFAQVFEASSNLRSRSEQVTVGLGGVFGRGIVLNASYTWQRAQDQATGGRGGNTAGDPTVAEWATSDFQRTHSLLTTITYPVSRSIELTSIARATSGTPYTPMAGGDVNGDGSRNDRAFVFAPGAGGTEAQAMQRLIGGSSGGARDCLLSQVGTVARRNSCAGPWQYALDFQMNWRPTLLGLNRRLTVSVVTQNFLRGVDELLHGVDGAKGWGLAARPDNTLLYVTGFDQANQRYAYTVNERFGSTAGTATAFRPPFQIGINMRLTIGPDRGRAALDAMRGGGGRGGPGGGFGGDGGFGRPNIGGIAGAMIARLDSALPNPAAAALDLRDSLRLTPQQILLLEPLRDSLLARNRTSRDSMRALIAAGGNNPDPQRLLPALRPLFDALRTSVSEASVTVRAILTDEQWAMMPEAVRNFQAGQPFGPGRLGMPGQQREGPRPRP